ncbi:hypothetical protein U0E23_29350 [Burkholderia stagnalis]|nr:hypothetical protein [Burkholderia stagnalis]
MRADVGGLSVDGPLFLFIADWRGAAASCDCRGERSLVIHDDFFVLGGALRA